MTTEYIISDQLRRATEARDRCRADAPKMHSAAWRTYFIHRWEWHQAWLDYGRAAAARYKSTGEAPR